MKTAFAYSGFTFLLFTGLALAFKSPELAGIFLVGCGIAFGLAAVWKK